MPATAKAVTATNALVFAMAPAPSNAPAPSKAPAPYKDPAPPKAPAPSKASAPSETPTVAKITAPELKKYSLSKPGSSKVQEHVGYNG